MPGFFRRSNSRSYDLLSSFSFYVPGNRRDAHTAGDAADRGLSGKSGDSSADVPDRCTDSAGLRHAAVISGNVPAAYMVCIIPKPEKPVLRSGLCPGQQSFRKAERMGCRPDGGCGDSGRKHDYGSCRVPHCRLCRKGWRHRSNRCFRTARYG